MYAKTGKSGTIFWQRGGFDSVRDKVLSRFRNWLFSLALKSAFLHRVRFQYETSHSYQKNVSVFDFWSYLLTNWKLNLHEERFGIIPSKVHLYSQSLVPFSSCWLTSQWQQPAVMWRKNESSYSKSLYFQTIYHGLLECFFSDRFALYLIFWTHWIFEEDMRLFDGEYLLLLTSRKTLTIGGKRPLAVEDLVWMCDKHYHHFSFIMRFLRLFMLVMLVSIHFNHTENWRCRDRDIFKLVYSLCKLTETMYLWRPKTMPEMSPSATEKPKT